MKGAKAELTPSVRLLSSDVALAEGPLTNVVTRDDGVAPDFAQGA
ncbi:hypothetical protein [Anaeromyxobacter oryzisoli]|nr:hypothetical protein [Anaeromyxobacter sp. SG63]